MLHSPLHICALIPTFNNAGTIEDVIRRVHQQVRDIIVVDDGCTDNTKELLSAIEVPVTVVTHSRNQGKGRALASGFRKALEMGFDYALTIDADGQHYPEDIPLLIRALESYIRDTVVPGWAVSLELISTKDAVPFYRRMGFEERPCEWDGPGMMKMLR